MPGAARTRRIRNEFEWISRARIFGLRAVVVVGYACNRIERYVLQDGAETVGRVPNHRLRFLRKLDGLGVATAFEIEDAVRSPTGLVVADQDAVGVGGERGLART